MSIRCAAKAVVVHEGKVLLDYSGGGDMGAFYTLPGGGQNQYETIREAIVRECLEETGYTVIPEAFVGLCEEISTNETYRVQYPDYTHKVMHIYRCRLADAARQAPTEMDMGQDDCIWVPLEALSSIRVLPKLVGAHMAQLLRTEHPIDLGTEFVAD